MKLTISDIAKLANVSVSTVSIVLNNKTGVSKAEEFFNSLRDNPNNQLNKLRKFPFKLFLIN